MLIERETSSLKNSIILDKHPVNPDVEKLLDSKLFGALKEEVVKRIKEEFALETREEMRKNEALELYIDNKVKDAIKDVFPYEPEKDLKEPIEFTNLCIAEEEVSGELTKIYKKAIFRFHDMQLHEGQLLKKI